MPKNKVPKADKLTVSGLENQLNAIVLSGTDPDGTVVGYALTSLPTNGALYLDAAQTQLADIGVTYASNTFFYLPDPNFIGTASFSFSVEDNQGGLSKPATVKVDVNLTTMNLAVAGDIVDLDGVTGTITLLGADLATYRANKFGTVALAAAQGVTTVNATAEATLSATGNAAATTFDFGTGVVTGADTVNAVLKYTGFTMYVASANGDTVTLTATGQNVTGGAGADTVNAGPGAHTLSGGGGADTFNVNSTGTVTIADLGAGGNDILVVSAGATASATLAANWTASSATSNNGTTSVNAAGLTLDVSAAAGAMGWTLTNSGGGAILTGSKNDDTIIGGDLSDILVGGLGKDALNGGAGADWASYRTAATKVTASLASPSDNTGDAFGDSYTSIERLEGSAFDDTLIGDSNDNSLRGLGGADTLIGGGGFDTASYFDSPIGLIVSLATPAINTGEAKDDVYISIENLSGSAYDDKLTGNNNDFNTLLGNGGADELDGGAGFDYAAYNNATKIGATTGVTASLADPSANTGEAAGDKYTSIEGLRGSDFDDTLIGDGGANWLEGRGGADALFGGAGGDTASYYNAPTGVTASLVNPLVDNKGEAAGDSYDSIENLGGSRFGDALIGNTGNNVLVGQGGADALIGGNGFDSAAYYNATTGVRASLDPLFVANTGEALGDTYDSIENLIGSNFGDFLAGDAGNNRLLGGPGGDKLYGGAGNDEFWGNSQETLFDQAFDVIDYSIATGLTAGITVVWGTGTISSTDLQIGTDSFRGIETIYGTSLDDALDSSGLISSASPFATDVGISHFFRGGGGDDKITGNNFVELLYDDSTAGITVTMSLSAQWAGTVDGVAGGVGKDTFTGVRDVIGSTHDDTFVGAGFRDIFDGGVGGSDTFFGGGGFDSVEYDGGATRVAIKVNLGAGTVTGEGGITSGPIGLDVLHSIEAIRGSNFADEYDASTFTADNAATPSANAGSGSALNQYEGYGGADIITGNGSTQLAYFNAAGAVNVTMSGQGTGAATAVYAATASHTFTGVSQIFGGNFADSFVGGSGSDNFVGQSGNDTMTGGAGADTLAGGLGDDGFVFGSRSDTRAGSFAGSDTNANNVDKITDFIGNGAAAGDVITFGTATNAFGAAITFTGATVANVLAVGVLSANDFNQLTSAAGIIIDPNTNGFASTASTAQIYDITVGSGNLAGRWLILNDDVDAVTASDTIVSITGVTGALNSADFQFA